MEGSIPTLPEGPFYLHNYCKLSLSWCVFFCLLSVIIQEVFFFLWHLIRLGAGLRKLCLLQYKICMIFNEAAGRAETMGQRQANVSWVFLVAGQSHVSLPGSAEAEQRDRKKTCKMLEKKEHMFPLRVIMCSPCLCSHPSSPQAQGNVSEPRWTLVRLEDSYILSETYVHILFAICKNAKFLR